MQTSRLATSSISNGYDVSQTVERSAKTGKLKNYGKMYGRAEETVVLAGTPCVQAYH